MSRGMRGIVLAVLYACSGGDAPHDAAVAPADSAPPWPIYDTHRCSFLDEDGCLLDRYTHQWEALQGREVGGMEEMLGEAFAGSAAVAAAVTPKGDGPPTVEQCNELPHDWVTVGAEHLRRPQRD